MLYRPRLDVLLIRPLSRAFFLLALVGGGTTSLDPDAALAQTLDRGNDTRSTGERAPIWPDQWPWSSIGRINIAKNELLHGQFGRTTNGHHRGTLYVRCKVESVD